MSRDCTDSLMYLRNEKCPQLFFLPTLHFHCYPKAHQRVCFQVLESQHFQQQCQYKTTKPYAALTVAQGVPCLASKNIPAPPGNVCYAVT